MSFFFMKSKVPTKKNNLPKDLLYRNKCKLCPMRNKANKLEPIGSKDSKIYIITNYITNVQDETKDLFTFLRTVKDKKTGKIIREETLTLEEDLEFLKEDFRIHPLCKCLKTTGQKGEAQKISCRSFLEDDIIACSPKLIIGFGRNVLEYVLGTIDIKLHRGRVFPVKIKEKWFNFLAVEDPYEFFSEEWLYKKHINIFKNDCKKAFIPHEKKRFENFLLKDYETNPFKNTQLIDGDYALFDACLKELEQEDVVSIDIETDRLRPYDDGKILTVAIAGNNLAISFPLYHPGQKWGNRLDIAKVKTRLKKFLLNENVIKVAHELMFELEWFYYYFGKGVLNYLWSDTMVLAYLLDEREGGKDLDILTRLYLGFNLKSIFNVDTKKLTEYPVGDVMKYNVLDAKYTLSLYRILYKIINREGLAPNVDMFINTIHSLVIMQNKGVSVDLGILGEFDRVFKIERNKILIPLLDSGEARLYKQHKQRELGLEVLRSNKEIGFLFKDLLKCQEGWKTNKDGKKKYSVDEEVLLILKKQGMQFADNLLKFRAIDKKITTYTEGLQKVIFEDNKFHTNYRPTRTTTGRLSSSEPNLQNFPKRKGKEIRKMVSMSSGKWLVSVDYGQIEARVICMASKDKNYVNALYNDLDVHLDWSKKLKRLYPEIMNNYKDMKELRNAMKNKWVFPQFFGASYFSCARSLSLPIPLAEQLALDFWRTFEGVKKWQEELLRLYKKTLYVETLTGRRRRGPLSYNELMNSPIQGTASDIVVNAMNSLIKNGVDVRMNIHDDITFIADDNVLDQTIEKVVRLMTKKSFDFINVPLTVEVELGKNWAQQKPVGVFCSEKGWIDN